MADITPEKLFTRELTGVAIPVVAGAILTILDATIVNVALPALGRDLHTSITTVQWVPTIYLLAFATVIPMTGWATDRFGARRVWLAALSMFVAGSLLCALSQETGELLAGRVVQGLGGGMVMPIGQTMLAQVAGPQRMGRVMAVVGVPMLLAPIVGPVVGGALVDAGTWRWIFLVNVPVGLLALGLAVRLLPRTRPRPAARLDRRGLLLLPPALALFVYGLADASAHGGLTTASTVSVCTGLALAAAYVGHARTVRTPLLDVSLFGRRGFGSAAVTNLLVGIALFAVALLLPLYLQIVRGLSPLQVGLLLIPQGVGAGLAMAVAGGLTDRVGARWVVTSGVVVAAVGTAMFTQLTATTSYESFCAALLLVGIGLGASVTPAMAAGFRDLEPGEMPQGSSAIATVQRVAGSIGTALLAGVLQHTMRTELPGFRGEIAAARAVALTAPGRGLDRAASAFGTTFAVALALTIAALVPALLLPRLPRAAAPTGRAGSQSGGEETDHDRPAQPHDRVRA